MSDENQDVPEAVKAQRRAREHEAEAREHEPAERPPDDTGEEPDRPAPPGQAEQPRG